MPNDTQSLVQTLLKLPVFRSEWVLYLLIALSVISVGVMLERWIFYRRRKLDVDALREALQRNLDRGNFAGAAKALADKDALETNVVLVGLQAYEKGPESVEDLIAGALGREKGRYEKRLDFLATLASNAPYIGLFGTVLGIVRSFRDLAANMAEASSAVMAGIAEALIATAVGLLVAIPAVVAFNVFKGRVKHVGHRLPDAGAHPAQPPQVRRAGRARGGRGGITESRHGLQAGRSQRRRAARVDQHHPVRRHRAGAAGHLHAHVGDHRARQPEGGAAQGGQRRQPGRIDHQPAVHEGRRLHAQRREDAVVRARGRRSSGARRPATRSCRP